MPHRYRWLLPWLLLAILPCSASGLAAEAPFPRSPELRDRVEFWKKIFTLYDTHQAVVHDREDLSLVYGVEDLGRVDRSRQASTENAILERYRRAMERLAVGEVDSRKLSDEEWRIWQAHGQSRDPERYRRAAERLRLQVGQRNRMAQGLVNWQRYGVDVCRILRENGVPDSLAVLAFIESAFNPEARSKAGAVGLWQITRPAATRLLRMDRHVDERCDPFKATAAAARILKQNYEALGHWPLAITAYNHGAAGIARGVREVGSHDLAVLIDRYQGKAFGFAGKNFYAEFLAALEVIPQHALYFGDEALTATPDGAATGQAEGTDAPATLPVAQLGPNAPNPFNCATTIAYAIEKARLVQVDIYDAAGQRIRNLVQQVQGPGTFLVAWDGTTDAGTPVASGIYFTRLQAGTWSAFRKLMLLR